MELGLRLSQKQTLKLVMTPRLQQALKLLQMPSLELSQHIEQELLTNPLLELDETLTENAPETPTADAEKPEATNKEVAPEEKALDSKEDKLDWSAYFDDGFEYAEGGRADREETEFFEVENFQDANVSRLVVERKTAKFILALNTITGGVIYSYSPHEREVRSTLASGLGYITDLIQDPCTGGFLVSTRDRNAPILFVGPESSACKVTTFTVPANHFPGGLAVDALALDTRMDKAGDHALWVLASNRLFRITWNSFTRTIRFPEILPVIKLPVGNPTAMIFEGNRDYLLVGTVARTVLDGSEASLTLRLGPSYSKHSYFIAASLAMNPGIPLAEGRMINLKADPLFFMSISGLLPTVFIAMNGETGSGGEVTGRVIVRRDWVTFLSGVTIYFAGVAIDPALPARVRTVTNTVSLTLF